MKILLVNAFDTRGGPGRWVYMMHRNFLRAGVDSAYLSEIKSSDDPTVLGEKGKLANLKSRAKQIVDYLPLLMYPRWKKVIFSAGWAPFSIDDQIKKLRPDLIHLNWINRGFVSIKSLSRFKVPTVWTMHDMWSFTGGCHYDEECGRYKTGCGQCPILGSNHSADLSSRVINQKKKYWEKANITMVAPSRWLENCAKESAVFKNNRVEHIPVGMDLEVFTPIDKTEARKELFLPLDKKLVLFGAVNAVDDKRKGFKYLLEALKLLAEFKDKIELVVFGSSCSEEIKNSDLKAHFLGNIYDNRKMSLVYSATDVFVAPSLQDNMPATVMESFACGTPVVAFNVGGMPDMLEHQKNGYLARPFESGDLAIGIKWVIGEADYPALAQRSRKKMEEEFDIKNIAGHYIDLYKNILGKI